MTSAPSRLQPLSGNRWLFCLAVSLFFAACSPKLRPVAVQPKPAEPANPSVKQPAKEVKPEKPPAPAVSTISLLLPFGTDHLAVGQSYSPVSIKEADIAIAYYQGFKLALDSLAGQGYNYKLQVYDTHSDKSQARALGYNPAVRASDVIVGPVFPDDMRAFLGANSSPKQPIVSPLSPAAPSTLHSAQMITMMPPLEYHAWAAAKYIKDKIDPEKIFILRSGYSEENEYILPFKKAIDSLGKKHIQVVTVTVMHGQLGPLRSQFSSANKNIFVVPATDQHFLTVTLRALDSLRANYPVAVFGHPSWVNFTFLKADLLQRLDTHITSSDHIDYKAQSIIAFMRLYRETYHTDATAFAIKGYDEGRYLGEQLAVGNIKNLAQAHFNGLHNDFIFQKKTGMGWINTHVDVYKYANFELKKVE